MIEKTLSRIHPSYRKFLPAVSLLSGISIFTILFSVITNKLIAILLGTYGVALMGLYRSLGSTVTGTLSLGYSVIFMQEISVDRTAEKKYQTIAASLTSGFLQFLFLSLTSLFFAEPIAKLLFSSQPTLEQMRDVRVVLFMAWINIALQNVIAIVRGNGSVRDFSKLQLVNSISTLLLIVPLIKLGSVGLALNVASGSAIALCVGTYLLLKNAHLPAPTQIFRDGISYLKRTGTPSLLVTWQSIATIGGLLLLQTMMQKNYGMDYLGNFAAAYLIIDTATNVLMSSVRSYFLPKFGELRHDEQKAKLLSEMVNLLLVLATIGIVLICALSPYLVTLLFSKKFDYAALMLVILSLSLLGAVYSWSYNTILLHKGETSSFTFADTIWMAVLLASSWTAMHFQLHAMTVVILYSACSLVCTAIYLWLTYRKLGRTFLPTEQTLRLTSLCVTIAAIAVLFYFKIR